MNLIDRVKTLWNIFTKGTLSKTDKLILVLAAVYCLSPLDAIPDVAPIVGFLDDFLVILATLRHLSNKGAAPTPASESEPQPVHVDVNVL